jgi:hypothetical protein
MKKFRIINLLILCCFSTAVSSQSVNQSFLKYSNNYLKVEFVYFFNHQYKLIFSSQIGDKPLSGYLLNENNLVIDSLGLGVRPSSIFHFNDRKFFISSKGDFFQGNYDSGGFHSFSKRTFSNSLEKELFIVNRLWNPIRFNDFLYGLSGSGNKTNFFKCDTVNRKVIPLIPSRKSIKVPNQKALNFSFSMSENELCVFVMHYQSLFIVNKLNELVSEIKLPSMENGFWYYFYDYLQKFHFFILEKEEQYLIYHLKDNNELIYVNSIDYFPSAIVGGKIHIKELVDGEYYHYLVPLSYHEFALKNKPIPLMEVIIRP